MSRIEVLAYPRAPNKRAAFSISSALLSTIKPTALSFVFALVALTLLDVLLAFGAGLGIVFIALGQKFWLHGKG
jgi:hypothetical protein